MKIILANPRGFCAGVNMAIESLERALELFGAPIYAYHEIVHNRPVVERFRERGVVFVENMEDIPIGATVLYSAHGVAPAVREVSARRHLRAIDATCPLVTKVHLEAIRYAQYRYHIVLIGHEGHDEVVGTMGEVPESITLVENVADVERLPFPRNAKVAYLTQTTLSVDETRGIIAALKAKYPSIAAPAKDDICYATQNRQEAVKELADAADVVLVLGSQNSSNSQRLAEISRQHAKPAYLIDGVAELRDDWFAGVETVLVTAGASAPEDVVAACVAYLRDRFGAEVETRTVREEDVHFPLPRAALATGSVGITEEEPMATVSTLGLADHGNLVSDDEFAEADFEAGYQYELIDGRLYVSYEPDPAEVVLNEWLANKLRAYWFRHAKVINFVAGRSRVMVPDRPGTTNPQPDVAVFRDFPRGGLMGASWTDFSPLLVAEVLVHSDPYKDLVRNVELYLQVPSIRAYWILNGRGNSDQPTLIVYRRRGAAWMKKREFPYGSTYTTPLLPGFKLVIDPLR